MKNHLKKQHIHVTNTMPRVITPIHKLLKKKKKSKKITSILNKAGSMVTTRLQARRKNIQQQQHHQAPQTKSAATPKRKEKTPYDSTAKMQENRKNPAFRFTEDFLRIMRKIQTDERYRPHHKSLTKYSITIEEINKVREKQNWEPIDIFIPPPYVPTPANVIQSEINSETKFTLSKIAEEQRMDIREKAGALEAFQKQLKKDNTGKIVEVDREEIFSIDTITHYFIRNPGFVGRNSSEQRRPSTLKNYFGISVDKDGNKRWDGKSGYFSRFFNQWREGHCSKDVRPCLRDVDDLLTWLQNEQRIWKKATSKLAVLIPLLVVLSEYPPLRDQPLAKSTLAKLETYKSKLDAGVRVEGTERREHESVSRFKDIREAIYDRFQKKNDIPVHTGKIHKAWIYIKMYDEQPVRDDWGSLKIMFEDVPRMFLNRVEKNFKDPVVKKKLLDINAGNILYVPDDARKPVTLAFHVYKTSNTYGITFVPFSIPLSTDIRNYISQLRNKTYLFGKGKMSSYVGKMLFDAGVKKKTNDAEYKPGLNTGSINLLRKSYVSTAFAAESLSAIDRETLAFAMKHSPMTSPSYLREHGLKVAQEQKNELEKIADNK